MNKEQAQQLLKTSLDNSAAQFRDGQWEAIDALVNHQQKLLVARFILLAPRFFVIAAWDQRLLCRPCLP